MGEFYVWPPSLLWVNVISDLVIAASCYSIPLTLYYFIRRRPDLKLYGSILILACGTTCALSVWGVWHPAYRFEGFVKAIAAVMSIATVCAMIRLTPAMLKIAAPEQTGEVHEAELLAGECFEAASQAILGVSGKGIISLVNRRTEEMFGYSRAELLGQHLDILLPERFRAGYFLEPRVRAMGAGMELAGRRKDGTEFPVEIGLAHVNTPDGPLAFGMVSDISERRKAAEDLKRVNEELRRSNIEIEQFAHIASHDLQEPLRMVSSYLQLVERRYAASLDDDGREFIGFAVDGATRMKALIKDLLTFSRAGTNATSLRAVSGDSVLQNALDNLRTAIDESGAEITVEPLPTVVVDPVLFTQVFQNLIANAIKFQKGAAPCIHISVERVAEDWIFAVRDNGIGIEQRHLDRIFRIFERLHDNEEYAGSGIGLAVTKKIVERHGGTMWVESQPGTGSTFYFTISAEMSLANAAKC